MSRPDLSPGSTPTHGSRTQVLLHTALELVVETDIDQILNRIVEGAAAVADAQYAALATYEDGIISRFVHHGMEGATVKRIDHMPEGRGLLGEVAAADSPIRVDDVAVEPRAHGVPAGHPPMRTFLGVPVARGGRRYGSLYLAEKHANGAFDEDDEALVSSLAAFAAGAIEGVMLLEAQRERTEAIAARAAAEERAQVRRETLGQIIEAQEAERARVARDLHDDVGQALTSVLLGIRLIEGALRAEPRVDEVRQRASDLRELVTDALRRTRQLAFDLRPAVLDDIGLLPALERLSGDLRGTGLAIELATNLHEDDHRLAPGVETTLYRVAQEALTNVVRHAKATTARVSLIRGRDAVRLVISDDGEGFDPTETPSRLGLKGMAERARLICGHIDVTSAPGAGASVTLEVPLA